MLEQDAHFRPSLSPGQRAMEPTELAVCNVAVIRRTDEQTDHRIYLLVSRLALRLLSWSTSWRRSLIAGPGGHRAEFHRSCPPMLDEALCVLFAATRSRDASLACLFSTLQTQIWPVSRAHNEEHTQLCELQLLSRRRFADNLGIALSLPRKPPLLNCSVFAVPECQQRACSSPERFWLLRTR